MPCVKCIICPLDAAAESLDSVIYQLRHEPAIAQVPGGFLDFVKKLEKQRKDILGIVEEIKQLNSAPPPEH